jgi:hypothetical protein
MGQKAKGKRTIADASSDPSYAQLCNRSIFYLSNCTQIPRQTKADENATDCRGHFAIQEQDDSYAKPMTQSVLLYVA